MPECEVGLDDFNASWTSFAIRNNTNSCYRLATFDTEPSNLKFMTAKGSSIKNAWSNVTCRRDNFDVGRRVPCEKIVYENHNTIMAEVSESIL